jgi:hypothetical protein
MISTGDLIVQKRGPLDNEGLAIPYSKMVHEKMELRRPFWAVLKNARLETESLRGISKNHRNLVVLTLFINSRSHAINIVRQLIFE